MDATVKNLTGWEVDNEFLKEFGYMTEPDKEIYLRKNISMIASDFDYDQSPVTVVFMTKPDCTNIVVQGEDETYDRNHPRDMMKMGSGATRKDEFIQKDGELFTIPLEVRKMLVQGTDRNDTFIPLITNLFEESGVDPVQVQLDTFDAGENRVGVRQTTGRYLVGSQSTPSFQLSFYDISKYDNDTNREYGSLIMTSLHKAWVRYINDVKMGIIHPGGNYSVNFANYNEVIQNFKELLTPLNNKLLAKSQGTEDTRTVGEKSIIEKELTETKRGPELARMLACERSINYMSSLYYFKLGSDGETINYWGVYTGCFPKSYGADNLSTGSKEVSKISVEYQAQFYEDLNIHILQDFNKISLMDCKLSRDNTGLNATDDNFLVKPDLSNLNNEQKKTTNPFIIYDNVTGKYKLRIPNSRT